MFNETDPLNRKVKLKRNTWDNKILNLYGTNDDNSHGNSHEEMQDLLSNIKSTITNPTLILQDTKKIVSDQGEEITVLNEKRNEYYKVYINIEDLCLNCLKVVVEFDQESNGDIVTTHKMNGKLSKIKTEGGVIYDSSERS